ncbi:MAG: allophanate hydrolase [Ilumatobacteraceae bacterium]|nr:allophanate hydrolase [Ilumatobacteraceae bacterium]
MTASEAVERSLAAIDAEQRDGIWISLVEPEVARARAAEVDRRVAAGSVLALAGQTLAVKDNIDVAGLPTTAGCPAYAYRPTVDAPAVRALIDAGAVVMGKTNLDQFATGLVGTRTPYGITPNVRWPGLVSGGSSSGSAAAVAAGLVDLALGTDTAGSGRVPAAANGIVGVKPTRGRLSIGGVVPACRSLDCVSVFAPTVQAAVAAADVAASSAVGDEDPWRRTPPAGAGPEGARPLRIGIPVAAGLTFDGDPDGSERFDAATRAVLATGVGTSAVPVDLLPFIAVARLLYEGAFVAERYEAVGGFVQSHRDEVHPVVRDIVLRAGQLRAFEVFRDQTELARRARALAPIWERIDVLVVPSVPRIPTIAEVQAGPIEVNAMLGTYTNFVNLLDLAAVTLPVPTEHDAPDRPPTSITLIGPAWSDGLLASVAADLAPHFG